MKKLMLSAACGAVLAFSSAASAADLELKLATIAPEGTPWMGYLAKWEAAVEEASGGSIDIQIFHSGQLGNEFDTYSQVRRGRIDAGLFSAQTLAGNVPEVSLMSTPFLFDNVETIDCVYDGEFGDMLEGKIEEQGFEIMTWNDAGWVNMFGQDDLSDVAAAEGYKVRVAPHGMSRLLWNSAGALGTEMPFSDIPSAMQTGLVRAGESATIVYVAMGLSKIGPHLTLANHSHQAGALAMSAKVWESMTDEQRAILSDNLPPLAELRASVRGTEAFLVNKFKEAGGALHIPTDEQRAAWVEKVSANYPQFVADLGGDSEAAWEQLMAAKAACEQ